MNLKILYKQFVVGLNNLKIVIVGLIIIGLIYLGIYFNLANVIINFIPFISSSLVTISLVNFYLDDFSLSKTSLIKYIQIFCFICILFSPFIYYYFLDDFFSMVFYLGDNSKDGVNLHGHVNLDKEAAKYISQGINTIGSQIGLTGTITGVSTAVAKGITKSSIPPLQKAIIIGGGAVLGGMIHMGVSAINRNSYLQNFSVCSIDNNISNNNISNSHINKFMDDFSSNFSPLQELLLSVQIINYVCLSLVFILAIQLLFKFFIKDNININISNIVGINFDNKFNYYLNKIIILNKKMNNIYIWVIILLLLIGLIFSGYFITELCDNLDKYINVHNYLKGNK